MGKVFMKKNFILGRFSPFYSFLVAIKPILHYLFKAHGSYDISKEDMDHQTETRRILRPETETFGNLLTIHISIV